MRPDAGEATSEGPVVMPLAVAAERHADIVERHLGSVVTARTRLTARERRPLDRRDARLRAARRPRRGADRPDDGPRDAGQCAAPPHARRARGGRAGGGLAPGAVQRPRGRRPRQRGRRARRRPERQPALRRRPGAVEKALVFGAQRAIVERDATLDWITLGFGSANGKVFLETQLAGRGASGTVTGAYATRGRQHLDFDTLQEHAAPDTTSDLAFRGILNGRSSTVWRGMIQVDRGRPAHRRLPGVAQPAADARRRTPTRSPGLEILANDVRCTHAAAIAQIDREQVFYLRSHGLPQPRRAPPGDRGLPRGDRRAVRGRARARRGLRVDRAPARRGARLLSGPERRAPLAPRARAGTAAVAPRSPRAARGSAGAPRRRSSPRERRGSSSPRVRRSRGSRRCRARRR